MCKNVPKDLGAQTLGSASAAMDVIARQFWEELVSSAKNGRGLQEW